MSQNQLIVLLGTNKIKNTRRRNMAQPKRKKDNYEELVKLIRQISPVNLQRLLEFAIGEFKEIS